MILIKFLNDFFSDNNEEFSLGIDLTKASSFYTDLDLFTVEFKISILGVIIANASSINPDNSLRVSVLIFKVQR